MEMGLASKLIRNLFLVGYVQKEKYKYLDLYICYDFLYIRQPSYDSNTAGNPLCEFIKNKITFQIKTFFISRGKVILKVFN